MTDTPKEWLVAFLNLMVKEGAVMITRVERGAEHFTKPWGDEVEEEIMLSK